MIRKSVQDPLTLARYRDNKSVMKPWVEASLSSHIWVAELPPDLMPGTYDLKVMVQDEYGRSFAVENSIELLG